MPVSRLVQINDFLTICTRRPICPLPFRPVWSYYTMLFNHIKLVERFEFRAIEGWTIIRFSNIENILRRICQIDATLLKQLFRQMDTSKIHRPAKTSICHSAKSIVTLSKGAENSPISILLMCCLRFQFSGLIVFNRLFVTIIINVVDYIDINVKFALTNAKWDR